MTPGVRVLGIDASLRSTGLGVVEARGSRMIGIAQKNLRMPAGVRRSDCLRGIFEGIRALIAETEPKAAALESGFFHRNAKTADILGQVRGVAVAACACAGVPVFEYAPRRAKQALVGFGGAEKDQVMRMVVQLLGLDSEPQEDVADALAVAICHLHTRTGHAALDSEPI
ncbi:MAG: crossover junction endodeoxyribonuclease RuvC [Verrucomicrobia bacterium]|nr:crossover junction endodeoxyribonuclease RuvC [Verrucomicrobiota bacterium]